MPVVRVGPLPGRAIEAATEFHARMVPEILAAAFAHAAGGSPLPSDEDVVLVFQPAPHDHRAWRLAAIQDLARAAAPRRVNGIVGDSEPAVAATLAWLEQAPGVTGQLLSIESG